MSWAPSRVVELAGGVGGARLGHGLQSILGSALSVVVNTGDDLERHGLLVCPDHDTVLYTLAGIEGPFGWGIAAAASGICRATSPGSWRAYPSCSTRSSRPMGSNEGRSMRRAASTRSRCTSNTSLR